MEPERTAEEQVARPWHQLAHKVDQVSSSVQILASKESIDELRDALDISRRLNDHPYGVLVAALGAGYILGGGLFSSTTRRLFGAGLAIGFRVAIVPLLREQLMALRTSPDDQSNESQINQNQGAKS